VSSFSEFYISSGKRGGAAVLGEWHDIVTGETCVPASLNVNNSEAAVCISLFCSWGCAYLGLLSVGILGKTVQLPLTLLMSSSDRLLIIHCPRFILKT
jgi:hypothetical protein